MTEKDLLKLKREIDEAKTSVADLNGQLTAMMKQLKKDWNCASVEDGEKLLKKMKKEIEGLEEQIETGVKEIEEKYEQ